MSARRWRKSEVHEALVVLYLRLNGYFTTGLVVQSPEWGKNRTEIDCLAIRHPNHDQPERELGPAPFLGLREGEVDLLICEVKSVASELAFNERLKRDPEVVQSVLDWAGVFRRATVPSVVERLLPLLQDGVTANHAREGVSEAGVRVRGLLCGPPCGEVEVQDTWCLVGAEILRFANDCFNPAERRVGCSTRYNFQLWGSWLAPIVECIKSGGVGSDSSLDGLYWYLDAV